MTTGLGPMGGAPGGDLSVVRQEDGRYRVEDGSGSVHASDLSNSEAWRFVDRRSGELTNKSEQRSDWFFNTVAPWGGG